MTVMSDGPPDSWYDPPEGHEVDLCFDCHENGCHENAIDWWAQQGCIGCQDELRQEVNLNVDS